jgi:hypothetical protein
MGAYMSYVLFNQPTYYELKEPLQRLLNPYNIVLDSSTFILIYDNIIPTDSEIKILGTLVNLELKIKDVLIIKIPESQELLEKIKIEFNSSFVGHVSDDYDRKNARIFYQTKLKYNSTRGLKGAIKIPLLKVNPSFYSSHGWNQSEIEEINNTSIESLKLIHAFFDSTKEKLKKELDDFKKIKIVIK